MKKGRNELVVGMFVIIGFLLLTITVFFVSGVYLFRPGYHVNVMYEYVSILDRGAPVRMAGVRIGEVSGVDLLFDPEAGKTRVRARVFIEKGVEVRDNYQFFIRGTHILSEPHIEVSPQPGAAPVLHDGDTITGVEPIPLESLIQRAHDIASHIDAILASFEEAMGDEESRLALKKIVLNLADLTESLNKVFDGSEEDLAGAIQDISASAGSLSRILESIEKGEGTAGKLVMEDQLYKELEGFVKEIKAKPWRLLKRDGDKKFLGIF